MTLLETLLNSLTLRHADVLRDGGTPDQMRRAMGVVKAAAKLAGCDVQTIVDEVVDFATR